MKLLSRAAKGFTLLEVLIVLVILAVLAGLAIPAYNGAVEKARSQEALRGLIGIRESMMRHFAISGSYAGASLGTPSRFQALFGFSPLDYNPNLPGGGQTGIFFYTLSAFDTSSFSATASRIGPGAPSGNNTVSINEAGTITRTGVYV